MDPTVFVEQKDIRPLIKALETFANQTIEATARRNELSNAKVDAHFLSKLTFNTSSIRFANTLVANFRRYSPSKARPDYHPMVKLLEHFVASRDDYEFDDLDVMLFEKLIEQGRDNLDALTARRTVGLIESPQGTGIGTGVYVGGNLLLTCYHVLKDVREPVWVRFGYTERSYRIISPIELDLNVVSKNARLDYALVRLKTMNKAQLIPQLNHKPQSSHQQVRMIHHPQGKPVVVSELGQITQVGDGYIDHTIRAEKGSSGAPLFNKQWHVVALHRGVPGLERSLQPNTLTALPIFAIWKDIEPHLS